MFYSRPLYWIRSGSVSDQKSLKNIGRNDICHCGSGKKFKKCCSGKRPSFRHNYLGHHIMFDGLTVGEDGIPLIHLPSGEWVRPDAFYYQTGYIGESGKPKITNMIDESFVRSLTDKDIWRHLNSYDLVVVMDTNTKPLSGEHISVSVAKQLKVAHVSDASAQTFGPQAEQFSVFKGLPGGEAEKFAWLQFIKYLKGRPYYRDGLKVAIITDHDAMMHNAYNTRKLPIFADKFLPEGFSLIYARGDGRKDSNLNEIIAKCDRLANTLLRDLEVDGCAFGDEAVVELSPDSSTEHIRQKLETESHRFARRGVIGVSTVRVANWHDI